MQTSSDAPHEMQLVRTHDSGAEEWHCPTCGRRFLMHWPPSYKKVVLEVGDEFAAHVGGKGGTQVSADEWPLWEPYTSLEEQAWIALADQVANQQQEELGLVPETPELAPWLRWMRLVGLAAPSAESGS